LVVCVVETDVDIGNVADLVLGQHTEDPLLKQLLNLATTVLQLLLVVLVRFRGKQLSRERDKSFYVAGDPLIIYFGELSDDI
jgi:ACR3 family arsenite efflux pump ArsB